MARIRTIKPEFWAHPVMAKQDDATRLMAIALLNFADDEGYFHAEPNLVRGFCRPFDDNSTITRRCLDNLSKISYITIHDNPDYGFIGFIEKFSDHQRIDRPSTSKLKEYYSTNVRRVLDDDSLLEGKGKERKGIRRDVEFINDNIKNAWLKWVEYKKTQFKFEYKTTDSEQEAINNLIDLCKGNFDDAEKIVKQSIVKGWKGLFEIQQQNTGRSKKLAL